MKKFFVKIKKRFIKDKPVTEGEFAEWLVEMADEIGRQEEVCSANKAKIILNRKRLPEIKNETERDKTEIELFAIEKEIEIVESKCKKVKEKIKGYRLEFFKSKQNS